MKVAKATNANTNRCALRVDMLLLITAVTGPRKVREEDVRHLDKHNRSFSIDLHR